MNGDPGAPWYAAAVPLWSAGFSSSGHLAGQTVGRNDSGQGQNRTADTRIFSSSLLRHVTGTTGMTSY